MLKSRAKSTAVARKRVLGMKKSGLVLFMAVVFMLTAFNLGASTVKAAVTGGYNLKIMSFNVRNLHGDDGTVNSWDNRKGKAANAINGAAPDIIGMQEAYKEQIDYFIANCTGNLKSVGTSRFGNTTDEYSNVMYRSDKFNVLDWGQFWLSETPDVVGSKSSYDTDWPRMCTWVKFQAKDNANAIFYYFNTHFGLTTGAQNQAASIILDRVPKYVTSSDVPVFIGGDLNAAETTTTYATLQNSVFNDTWSQAGKTFTDDATYHGYTGSKTGNHIDWIFQKNAVAVNSIDINYYNESGLYPSDHFPVNLNVTIPLGGTNVALNKTATASGQITGEEPSKAVDGTTSNNSKWCVNAAGDKWLKIDLRANYNLNRWVVKHAGAGGEAAGYNTRDFKLQKSSDGTNWSDVDAVTGNTANITDRNVTQFTTRYVRLYITNSGSDNAARIYEFETYGVAASGTNVALNKTATASGQIAGEEAAKAVDGSITNNSKWCVNATGAKWLKVDLGTSYDISRWVVKHAGAGGENTTYNTKDFKLQKSTNGTTWTDVDAVTGNTANITDRNVTKFTTRYVRLYVTNSGSDNAARIYELELY